MHLMQNCLLSACVLLLCPKRTTLTPQSQNVRKFYNPGLNRIAKYPLRGFPDGTLKKNEKNERETKLHPLFDKARMIKHYLEYSEAGFDLTDAEMEKFKIWPRAMIPYFIDDFSFDKVLRDRIRGFLGSVNTAAGLNFVELPHPPNDESSRWLFFINRRGLLDCADISTKNFSNSGVQKVLLGYNCMSSAASLAEIVLAIAGVPPQHNAPNREEYVEVKMDNIMSDKKHLFDILKDDEWLFFDTKYDYTSAGHYDFHKYTVNGAATLNPVQTVYDAVGEGDGFSFTDILKIRMLYNYIARKKQTKAPECYKLFEPGTNFSSFQPKSEAQIQPRKKPNRYTGLNDDLSENLSNNENKEVGQNEESVGKWENGPSDGDQDDDDQDDDDQDDDDQDDDDQDNDSKSISKLKKIRKKSGNIDQKGRIIDKLAYKSDYETQEKK